MVHLDKESKGKKTLGDLDFDFGDDGLDEEGGLGEDEDSDEAGSEADTLEEFSSSVLKKMLEDSIPPIPNNFQLYFDRMLDERSPEFKKQAIQILELEDGNEDERRVDFEKRLKDSLVNNKKILQTVATLYKNLNLMSDIAAKRNKEIVGAANPVALQNVMTALQQDVERLSKIIKKQSGELKTFYTKNVSIMQEVDSQTIYDSKFGVYNRRYLLQQVEKELKLIEQFGHNSTLVMAKLSDKITGQIKSEKGKLLITRTISRLILKTSRRSDIIAHFGDGVFALLLKHSDLFSAKKACERLSDLVSSTNFFWGDNEIQLHISVGIAKMVTSRDSAETIECARQAMENCGKLESPYLVCEQDQENEMADEDDGGI